MKRVYDLMKIMDDFFVLSFVVFVKRVPFIEQNPFATPEIVLLS